MAGAWLEDEEEGEDDEWLAVDELELSSEKSISGSRSLSFCCDGSGLSAPLSESAADEASSERSSVSWASLVPELLRLPSGYAEGWLCVLLVDEPDGLRDVVGEPLLVGGAPALTDGLLPLGAEVPPLDPELLDELLDVLELLDELELAPLEELLDDCSLQATRARIITIARIGRIAS